MWQREENGAPGAIRTPGPQIRSLMLYPAELRVHGEALLGASPRIRNPYFVVFVAKRTSKDFVNETERR